jgi:transposase-like protein
MRNALAPVGARQRATVAAMLRTIFAQDEEAGAREQWGKIADALRPRFKATAELMGRSENDVLAYMAFPKQHWPQISSTNPLERVNKEIKHRADVVGIFPNDESIIRLVGALMLEQTDEWAAQRRYMTLETLAPISNDPFVSLPGVTA